MHSMIAAPELSIQFSRVWEFLRTGGQDGVGLSLGMILSTGSFGTNIFGG